MSGAAGPTPGEGFDYGFPLAGPVPAAGCADCAALADTIRARTVERDLSAAADGRVLLWRHLDQVHL